jgi:hypothetical protein
MINLDLMVLQDKAAANSDPWEWKDCIDKYSNVQTLVNRICESEK